MSSGRYADDGDTNDLLKSGSDPLAIHLANALEKTMQSPLHGKAADELRRLSAERDELLDALQDLTGDRVYEYQIQKARAAINKATGEQS